MLARTAQPIVETAPDADAGVPDDVVTAAQQFAPGSTAVVAAGGEGRLLWCAAGRFDVRSDDEHWALSRPRAIWIPAGRECAFRVLEGAQICTFSVGRGSLAGLSDAVCIVAVSALLEALMERLVDDARGDAGERIRSRSELLGLVFVDELRSCGAAGNRLPIPLCGELRVLCATVLAEPGSKATTEQWAERFGMTRKALARAFRAELRTTFGAWQRAVRVQEASRRLRAGASVTQVALDLGYDSLSAFTAMFRRTAGFPPGRLRRRKLRGAS